MGILVLKILGLHTSGSKYCSSRNILSGSIEWAFGVFLNVQLQILGEVSAHGMFTRDKGFEFHVVTVWVISGSVTGYLLADDSKMYP